MAKLSPEEIKRIQQEQNQAHAKAGGKPNSKQVEENKDWARAGTTGHKGRKLEK
ncbi:hypothetical protein [Kribbella sindirgiensis]|uniref:hypothetical protein n=1 Tax=Kribbella sindirgiensis TaxID=1124744 RepID=UPI0013F3FDB9|nr:hypothetical protein [Kribbella sindirgiensis]